MSKKKTYIVKVDGRLYESGLTEKEAQELADRLEDKWGWSPMKIEIEEQTFGMLLPGILIFCLPLILITLAVLAICGVL